MTSGLRESKEKKTLFEARVMPDEVVGASEAAVQRNLISPGGHGGGASGDSDPESDRGRRVQAASLAAGLADSEAGDAAWSDQPLPVAARQHCGGQQGGRRSPCCRGAWRRGGEPKLPNLCRRKMPHRAPHSTARIKGRIAVDGTFALGPWTFPL